MFRLWDPENQLQWCLLIFSAPREFFFQAAVLRNGAVRGSGCSQEFDRVEQCLRLWLFCSNGSPEGKLRLRNGRGTSNGPTWQWKANTTSRGWNAALWGTRASPWSISVGARCVRGQPRQVEDVGFDGGSEVTTKHGSSAWAFGKRHQHVQAQLFELHTFAGNKLVCVKGPQGNQRPNFLLTTLFTDPWNKSTWKNLNVSSK